SCPVERGRPMTDMLNVSLREETGTSSSRRLRNQGLIPAILYGHGEKSVKLTVPAAEVEAAIRHGSQMVDLNGGVHETALIRSIQRDCFGTHILHLDFNRVSAREKVVVTVPVELRGEAPGAKHGGVLEHHVYDVEIECMAGQIPEKLEVNIGTLELGESIDISDVPVPESIKILTPPETTVVSCQIQQPTEEEEAEEAEAAASAVEPEVIRRKLEEGEEESS
ncbi:MAG: 50S ribosomal protein L25, partial [Planctomycetota bacterium]